MNYTPALELSPILRSFEDGELQLRPIQEDDFNSRYLSWFADPDVTRFLSARLITHQQALEHWQIGLRTNGWAMLAIVLGNEGLHIGNVKVGPINWSNGVSDLVTVIGDKSMWGRGLASRAIQLAGDAAFTHLGLRKLSAAVADGNRGSLLAYLKAGFIEEGRLSGHELSDGESRDLLLISRFNPAFFGPNGH